LRPLIRLTLFVCFAALPVLGQNTPPPSAPPSPFLSFSGRFLDSASTRDVQGQHRTLRANKIKLDRSHDRMYVRAGGGYFVGYKLSTFTSRIGSPLSTFFNGEQYLPFEMYVNPDGDPTWKVVLEDGQDRLADFDFDSRGDIYLAYSVYGFGIVDLQGHLLKQIPVTIDPTPQVIFTFASDGHQYVVTSGSSDSTLYDATDPQAPTRIGRLGFGIYRWAKNAAGDAIALVQSGGSALTLKIYTPAALVSHGAGTEIAASQQASGLHFSDVTGDGTNFYAAQDGYDGNATHTVISTIAPSGQGYSSTEMPMTTGTQTSNLTFESGYLDWIGSESSGRAGTMYRYNGTQFESYDITSYLQANYVGLVHENPEQIVALCSGSQAFALSAADGLGDVFTLTPAAWSCLPAAPTDVTATAADSSATVYFSEPSDGGSPITSYTVTSSAGSHTATGASSPITVTGLTNGTTYTFTVTATNAVGTSVPSLPSNAATPGAALAPPAWFAATATSTTSVSVTWAAAAFAAHYELLRSSMGSSFTVIASPASPSYTDTGLTPSTTYLYLVRSVDSGGGLSATTQIDPATTILFTDDPLVAGTGGKAVHIDELRTAVNAMRAAAGLGAATFTDPTVTAATPIRAAHINELRSALDEARNAIGFGPGTYTDTITAGVTPIKAVHVQEIRNDVK
jgi:hypothetical protein